jgi:hypothetical protein
MSSPIQVALGTDIKRESVLINPSVTAAEPLFNPSSDSAPVEAPNNIIATGKNSRQLLKEIYGR